MSQVLPIHTVELRFDPALTGITVKTDPNGTLVYGPDVSDVCLAFMVRAVVESEGARVR